MRPSEEALMPSRRPTAHGERRIRGMIGLVRETRTIEGMKMPSVASRAPATPPRS